MAELSASIYILESALTDKVYIGSTTLSIIKRFQLHKTEAKHNVPGCCSSKELFDIGTVSIRLLETVPYSERLIRERFWLTQYTTAINKYDPYETKEEHNIRKKEYMRKRFEKLYENPEEHAKWLEHRRRKVICDCGKEIAHSVLARHKKKYCKQNNVE